MIDALAKKQVVKDQFRFGIGEWYGQSFVQLTTEQRLAYAQLQALDKKQRPAQACPFRGGTCNKTGGVCSLRLYHRRAIAGKVLPADGDRGMLRATCPNRFLEGGLIFSWIGDVLLGTKDPHVVAEVGFLASERVDEQAEEGHDVGRIDQVLLHPPADPMRWCALAIQAVYFYQIKMGCDFAAIAQHDRLTVSGGASAS